MIGDGYGRLGAEDGLAFGSVHPKAALEFVFWLIKTNFSGKTLVAYRQSIRKSNIAAYYNHIVSISCS